MGEICSLYKQAWLCGVTRNYSSWGYSPSFLIVLFFHIREGKEMGDVTEKMKEKTQHRIYKVLVITFLSLCMEKYMHVIEHFDVCLTNLGSPTLGMSHSQGTASLVVAALAGNRWAEYCQRWLNIHHLLISASSFCWSVNKYGKGHNYCSFVDTKVKKLPQMTDA